MSKSWIALPILVYQIEFKVAWLYCSSKYNRVEYSGCALMNYNNNNNKCSH